MMNEKRQAVPLESLLSERNARSRHNYVGDHQVDGTWILLVETTLKPGSS